MLGGSQSSPLYDYIGDTAQEKHDRQSRASLWPWDAPSTADIHASGTATAITTVVTRKYVGDINCTAAGPCGTAATSTALLATAAIGISSTAAPTCAVRDSSTTTLDFANKECVADFVGFSRNRRAGCAARPWTT